MWVGFVWGFYGLFVGLVDWWIVGCFFLGFGLVWGRCFECWVLNLLKGILNLMCRCRCLFWEMLMSDLRYWKDEKKKVIRWR